MICLLIFKTDMLKKQGEKSGCRRRQGYAGPEKLYSLKAGRKRNKQPASLMLRRAREVRYRRTKGNAKTKISPIGRNDWKNNEKTRDRG